MITLQCDKNLCKVIQRLFKVLSLDVKISSFSDKPSDILLLRNSADFKSPDARCVIVNSDDKELIKKIKGTKNKVITCGFSTRSTVTLSSISDSEYVVCLQRSVKSISEKIISPFETPVLLDGLKFDDVSILMMITAAMMCDANPELLKNINL